MARETKSYEMRGLGPSAMRSGLPDVAVHDASEVSDGRLRVQALKHVIAARVARQRRDARRLVVQIAEHDGLRRAGLRAGRRYVAVLDLAVFEARAGLRTAGAVGSGER